MFCNLKFYILHLTNEEVKWKNNKELIVLIEDRFAVTYTEEDIRDYYNEFYFIKESTPNKLETYGLKGDCQYLC